MIQELNELKWLLIPLYPVFVITMFGLWIAFRFNKSRDISLKVNLLGLSLEISAIEDSDGITLKGTTHV